MICAAVTKWKLEGLVPGGQGEELVSETDAEDRHAPEQLAYDRHLLLERLGIARSVRQKKRVEAEQLLSRGIVWEYRHRGARTGEPPQNGALAAIVDHRDSRAAGVGIQLRECSRDLVCKRPSGHRGLGPRHLDRLLDRPRTRDHDRTQSTGAAQFEDE